MPALASFTTAYGLFAFFTFSTLTAVSGPEFDSRSNRPAHLVHWGKLHNKLWFCEFANGTTLTCSDLRVSTVPYQASMIMTENNYLATGKCKITASPHAEYSGTLDSMGCMTGTWVYTNHTDQYSIEFDPLPGSPLLIHLGVSVGRSMLARPCRLRCPLGGPSINGTIDSDMCFVETADSK